MGPLRRDLAGWDAYKSISLRSIDLFQLSPGSLIEGSCLRRCLFDCADAVHFADSPTLIGMPSVAAETSQPDSQPSMLRGLSEEQQLQLTDILDDYLQRLEAHEAPTREELIAAYPELEVHPELHDALHQYLDRLDDLHRMMGGVATDDDELRGRILGDYQLLEEIGRGGMGIVFSAQQQSLNRLVAVKLLPMAAMLDAKYIERFRNEARAAASLEHPNIVPVYTVGEERGIHYFAMKLVEGLSLDRRIDVHNENETRPPTNSALLQFAHIADALHTAHDYGIVHRDIKPSNLLLDDEGKLWVADFGLARFQYERALTGTGEMIGTMRYMSPEQAAGRSEQVDHRTDIYSLGATLYELLTGQPAVVGEEGPNLLRTITSQSPIRLRKLRTDLPADLQIVLEKAMARHRDDRYATAQEFAEDLRRVVDGRTVSATRISPAVLLTRWTVAHSKLVSVAVAMMAMLGLAASTGTYIANKMITRERDLATDNLRAAHALERARGSTIDQLALVPGAEEVRRELIQTHLQYYKNFARQAEHDAVMQDELARAYTRMGRLSAELGKPGEAVKYYRQADTLLDQLVGRNTGRGEFLLHRRENLNHLVMALDHTGNSHEALAILRDAITVQRAQQVALADGHDLTVEYGLAESNYGLLLQKAGEIAAAEMAFQKSIDVLTIERADHPRNQKATRALAEACRNLGALYALRPATQSRTKSAELYEQALDIQLMLANQSRNRLRASIDLVTTYMSIGNLHLANQEPTQACEAFDAAVQIGERLVAISPAVDSYRRDLAVCLSNLGMSQYQQGDYGQAKTTLRRSADHYETLLNSYPEHSGLQSSLGIVLNNHGIVLQQVGEQDAAELAYIHAARLLESTQKEAATAESSEALRKVYVNHVRMLKDAGRGEEADRLLQRQLELLPPEKDKS